jgi:hypothetical protein
MSGPFIFGRGSFVADSAVLLKPWPVSASLLIENSQKYGATTGGTRVRFLTQSGMRSGLDPGMTYRISLFVICW